MYILNLLELGQIGLRDIPHECPFCHRSINAIPVFAVPLSEERDLAAFFSCPAGDCRQAFVGYYRRYSMTPQPNYEFQNETSFGRMRVKEFSSTIRGVSEAFASIYNQSFVAEQHKLMEICGVGYRKALEFLVKDYAISDNPDKRDRIERLPLAQVIKNYIEDKRIQGVSARAVWLGNDETHYVRKWEGKDVSDLKKLIDMTIHWVELVEMTKELDKSMPSK